MLYILFFFYQETTSDTIKKILSNSDVIMLILIILISGIVGGFANYYRSLRNKGDRQYFLKRSIITGMVASACVPLFLNMVSSSLLQLKNQIPDLFVFTGFCLIAAYFSFSFLKSLSDRTLGELDQRTIELDKKTANLEKESKKKDKLLEAALLEVEKLKKVQPKVEVPEKVLKNLSNKLPFAKQDISSLLNLLSPQENVFSNDRFKDLLNVDQSKSSDILDRLEASTALSKYKLGSSTFYAINNDQSKAEL